MKEKEFLEILLATFNDTSLHRQRIRLNDIPTRLEGVLPPCMPGDILGSYEKLWPEGDYSCTVIFSLDIDRFLYLCGTLKDFGWTGLPINNTSIIAPIFLNHTLEMILKVNNGFEDEFYPYWRIEGHDSYISYSRLARSIK